MDHPRGVGTIDEGFDTALREAGHDPLDREDERGRARDVADEREPRPVRHRPEQGVDDGVLRSHRERDRATTTRAPSRSAT